MPILHNSWGVRYISDAYSIIFTGGVLSLKSHMAYTHLDVRIAFIFEMLLYLLMPYLTMTGDNWSSETNSTYFKTKETPNQSNCVVSTLPNDSLTLRKWSFLALVHQLSKPIIQLTPIKLLHPFRNENLHSSTHLRFVLEDYRSNFEEMLGKLKVDSIRINRLKSCT